MGEVYKSKTIEVSHSKYWWLPMLHTFTWSNLTFRRFYRQKRTAYYFEHGSMTKYELEVHTKEPNRERKA